MTQASVVSHPLRWRDFRPDATTPMTIAYLLCLAVTSATLLGTHTRAALDVQLSASTNLFNLARHPLEVLFTSAFWLEDAWLFLPMAALVLAALPRAERRWGSWLTVALFAVGHVMATLITVGVIALGIHEGWADRQLTFAIDVGPSYGLLTVFAALLYNLPPHWWRRAAMVILFVSLAVDSYLGDFTDAGHLVAFVIGLVAGKLLHDVASRSRALAQH